MCRRTLYDVGHNFRAVHQNHRSGAPLTLALIFTDGHGEPRAGDARALTLG